ncbi:GNAT family N-acetyltransferase [Bacillus salacetis]|uniref:GNAT family N-acetyltransferase n=1 Tax=Bacillus salacetis TaxID=2315464 RepID=A0A3A1R585_9BACI|nr:GNAT family N-acetyltransferase [Bacillus salacetis]RIW37256.1 GNAT family N-acetyltransferase [Bacillus salacetis]
MEALIRDMAANDIEAVQKVADISWNDTYQGIIPREIQKRFLEAAYGIEMMNKRLETSSLFVVEVDGGIKGFANFSPVKAEGDIELGAIYLLPEIQGRGLGTRLLEKGIKSIAGIQQIFINVEEENVKGIAFYQKKGFQQLSKFEDDLFGHRSLMLRMALKINSQHPGGKS